MTGQSESKGPLAWIVVSANPGRVTFARQQLEARKFEVYLPMRLFENRKGETCARPFLDNYLFAHVPVMARDWGQIFSTPGVAGILGVTRDRAYGIKDSVVARIKAQEDAGYIRLGLLEDQAPASFAAGQRVKHVDSGVEALFVEQVDARRATILVSLFGRDSEHTVDLKHLASVTDR